MDGPFNCGWPLLIKIRLKNESRIFQTNKKHVNEPLIMNKIKKNAKKYENYSYHQNTNLIIQILYSIMFYFDYRVVDKKCVIKSSN